MSFVIPLWINIRRTMPVIIEHSNATRMVARFAGSIRLHVRIDMEPNRFVQFRFVLYLLRMHGYPVCNLRTHNLNLRAGDRSLDCYSISNIHSRSHRLHLWFNFESKLHSPNISITNTLLNDGAIVGAE